MFIYLSKKIAIPNNNKVRSIAWSRDHGFIACGGDESLLKVLKLDSGDSESGVKGKGLAAPRNLSMNQTLEGHNSAVQRVVWNEAYQKLTSSDQNGLIIVWMFYKGSWFEEMINNRNKSVVRDMAWTCDGHKICIVYDDGAIIVGSVDGNRLWGKELKGMHLSQVEWSRDGKLILIAVHDSEVHVYDYSGNFISKVPLPAVQGHYGNRMSSNASFQIIGIKWSGDANSNDPLLAIAFENGRIQFMRNECDETPIIIDVEMTVTCIEWNHNGTILGVTGRVESEPENKRNYVKFYTPFGDLLQVLKVPGKDISSCTWEKEGLRIALAVDSYIFFANIRPDYKWCCFASTVVYALSNKAKSDDDANDGPTNTVVFWHIPSDTKHIKSVENLLNIAAYGNYCVFATKIEDNTNKKRHLSSLLLCNAIGTPVDMINIELIVNVVTMNSTKVIAASKDSFTIWKFTTPLIQLPMVKGISSKTPFSDFTVGNDTDLNDIQPITVFLSRNDPILVICSSEKHLIVAHESGCFQQYLLSNASVLYKFNINCTPSKIQLNRDSSRVSIIDVNGTLFIYDFDDTSDASSNGKTLSFERHDVWDMKWANDNSDLLAVTEKTKLNVFNIKTMESEDPIVSSGYICIFEDLLIRTVLLDELINDQSENSNLKISDHIIDFETKALRDARQLLEKVGISEASQFIEEQSHPRLWKLFAYSALNALDLNTAELAFVKCKDYKGIQFTKRISQLQNDHLKRAEICAFNGQFDDAEKLYLNIDRRDLAIQLRQTLGEWQKVVDLIRADLAISDDNQLRDAICNLGDFHADNHNWDDAVVYYENCEAYDRLFVCYSILENYDGLKQLINKFNDNHPILMEFGRTFESVGMCKEAVQSYLKGKKIDAAINCCVTMSEWKMAIDLAHEYNVPNIDSLLVKYTQHLLTKDKHFDIIELYRKANKIYDAATMILKVINDEKKMNRADPILLKKLYVLIGLLYEEQRKSPMKYDQKKNTLNSLLYDESFTNAAVDFKSMDDPWKGAEAYHFLLLCQRQLYEGYYDAAMKTALHLRDYDDFIEPEEIYCLLALSSCANRSFSICSKAFIKLESCETIAEEKRKIYEELAIQIFHKNPPKDSRNATKSECTYCETMISNWCTVCPSCNTKFPICIASGRPIMDSTQQWSCVRCGHHAHKSDLVTFSNCPLCHKNLNN